ncbi:ABC-2 family transporter protein [Prochlorococcus sp. AH-736-E15]|nr:ABC-2 family transporter protein [Prochlorococcus sp. AH-736-E15]
MISSLINRKIFTLLRVQYSNMLEYRIEIALWAISGIIPFFMLNIWTNNNLNESINFSDVMLSRYFISAFFVRQFSVVWVVFTFEEDSLMGKVSPYLIQPLNPFIRYFAQHIAEQITRFPFALIIAIFFFIFNPESFWVPNLGIFFLSITSIFLSFLIQFLIQSIVACLCFWTEKASSIERLLFIPTLFLSGLLAPVASFPEYIQTWIYFTPFPYLINFPANLLSGNPTNVYGGFSMQILWILLLFPIFKKVWSAGTKKYTAMGS